MATTTLLNLVRSALALCAIPCADAVAQPGQLDASFGTRGTVTTSVSALDRAAALAIQPDGKIVVVGRTAPSSTAPGDFAIARYNASGTLDGTFGAGGKVRTDFNGFDDGATSVAVQGDGKILVAGFASFVGFRDGTEAGEHLALARYDTVGNLDSTFGTGGKVTLDRVSWPLRYFESCIGGGGVAIIGSAGLNIQSDGKIVVGATAYDLVAGGFLAVARFSGSGALDASFTGPNPEWPQCGGTNGVVLNRYYDSLAFGLALQPDGKIVIAGNYNWDQQVVLTRFLATGGPDTTFGSGGIATYPPPTEAPTESGFALALQSDGKIVVAGSMFRPNFGSSYREALEIKRYNANGTLDTSFGTNGTASTWIIDGSLRARAVAIDGAGNVVAAGCIETGGQTFSTCPDGTGQADVLFARFTPTGELQSTFGIGGKSAVDFSGFADGAFGVALQPDGKIVAAGFTSIDAAGQEDFALVRVIGGNVTCTYALSSTAAAVGPGAGFGTVTVTAPIGCGWSATSGAPWVVITEGSSGSGPGTVTYVYSANPLSTARAGTLTIAGISFSLTQAAASSPSSFSKTTPSNGATDQLSALALKWTESLGATSYEYCVDTVNNTLCDGTWNSTSATSASLAGLNPTTTYWWQVRARNAAGTLEANAGVWWSFRTANLCVYTLSPPSAIIGVAGGPGVVSVRTQTGCAWSAESLDAAVTITGTTSGTSSGDVAYAVAQNRAGASRDLTLRIAGLSFGIVQRGTIVPALDLNGDGRLDFLWQHQADGRISGWLMKGTQLVDGTLLTPGQVSDTNWKVVGAGDLDGDGQMDIVWQNIADGRTSAWLMNGLTEKAGTLFSIPQVPDTNWRIRSVGDLDGDGRADLFWQHQGDGRISVWLMNGTQVRAGVLLTPSQVGDTNWKIVGTADFDGNGSRDLVWHHQTTGQIAVWFMNGTTLIDGALTSPTQVPDTSWKIRAVGDLNADGHPDFIWQNIADGRIAVWLMNGLRLIDGTLLSPSQVPDTNWHIVGPR